MRKKLISIIAMTLMVVSMGAVSAQANNYTDRDFLFNFKNYFCTTGTLAKTDRTSSYMRCISAAKPYTAHVYSNQGGQRVDCSYGHSYQFTTGTVQYMLNNVYEKGYRNAGIFATRNYGYTYSASGKWSPDSV